MIAPWAGYHLDYWILAIIDNNEIVGKKQAQQEKTKGERERKKRRPEMEVGDRERRFHPLPSCISLT